MACGVAFYWRNQRSTGPEDDPLLDNHRDVDCQMEEYGDRELLHLGQRVDGDDELLRLEKELQEEEDEANRGCVEHILDGISVFLVRVPHRYIPGSLFVLCGLLGLFCGVGYTCYHYHPPQEFIEAILDDATVGFETRGTYIKRGQSTAKELFDEVLKKKPSKYTVTPNKTLALQQFGATDQTLKWIDSLAGGMEGQRSPNEESASRSRSRRHSRSPKNWTECAQSGCVYGKKEHEQGYIPMQIPDVYFTFVVESDTDDKNLYTADRMKSICQLEEDKLLPLFGYTPGCSLCGFKVTRSLPQTIASYFQKDCQQLNSDDLETFRTLLNMCLHSFAPLLENMAGDGDADDSLNREGTQASTNTQSPVTQTDVPQVCQDWKEMVLDVRESLTDKQFTNLSAQNPLTYAPVFVQNGIYIDDPLGFYHAKIEKNSDMTLKDVHVTAFGVRDESIKWNLFQEYFISDTLWFGLAMGLVFAAMLLYLWRIDLVIATIISVAFGFIFAYAIYYFILKMKFFPFINLLALLVLIAVGADDVFVFFDIYQQTKKAHPNWPLEKVISRTLGHAALSVFVTSLTTSAAFFANAVSNITAIKVFGIFAGTAILVNFFVMVLVVPCIIILVENLISKMRNSCAYPATISKVVFCECEDGRVITFLRNIFIKYFPRFIDKTWYIWLVLLSIIGILAGICVFAYPKFNLPNTKDFQLFPTSNLIENWFFNVNKHFYFVEDEGGVPMVAASYVFGFEPEDGGNHWDPADKKTTLVEDAAFNFYQSDIQSWLSDFCEKQKTMDYVPDRFTDYTCNFKAYSETIKAMCGHLPTEVLFALPRINECCATGSVPFNSSQLENCIPIYMALLFNDFPQQLQLPRPNVTGRLFGDLIFEESTNQVKGYLLYVVTNWPYTFKYNAMQEHYNRLVTDFTDHLQSAPPGLQSGFVGFNADFYFFDLQHSLATGAYYSVGLSLAVAFLVMLFTSLNVLITIYAMVSITLAIMCTIATIVLMGWHLNVIEAVIISLSVGLSIDFTIHYGVAYRLSDTKKAQLRVHDSFRKVGGAVAMAALTTFLAGAGLMPCRVLPYIKLGIFLMLVMVFAWLYANLFFQSLCRVIGPRGNFCQISALCSRKKQQVSQRDADRISLNSVDSDDSLLVTF